MRRVTRAFAVVIPALALSLACADDPTPVSDEESGTEGSDEEGEDESPGDDEDSDSAETSGGTTTGAESSGSGIEPGEPIPARGIALTGVYANQGVEVPLVVNGEYVDVAGRNAQMVQGRNTLVRALWVLDDAWTPREIRAVMTMTLTDGTEELASKTIMVSGESVDSNLDTNLWFVLPGELVQPGAQFQLELFETGPGAESLPESPYPAYPPEPAEFGVIDAPMTLRSLLVPVHHNLNSNCPYPPTFDEQTLQPFIDQLYMQNPVENVEIEVREPIEYTGSMNSFNGVLSFLADLRVQDGADPSVYYYGIVRPCDGGPDGVGGQAISIPGFPSQDNAWTRVAVGRWNNSLSSTAHTYVHELGHTQGRRHVACSGNEGGPDPSYPYEGGIIGVWGFGIVDFSLHTPGNAKDYMTYCGNTWVSDWGWEYVIPYIQEITSWDLMGPPAPAPGTQDLLVGLIDPTAGEETRIITKGKATGRTVTSTERLSLTTHDGQRRDLTATVGPMGDGDSYTIAAELPDDIDLSRATNLHRETGTEIRLTRY